MLIEEGALLWIWQTYPVNVRLKRLTGWLTLSRQDKEEEDLLSKVWIWATLTS